MLDRKQYDLEMEKARHEEIDYIAEYLSEYIKLNAEIREQKVGTEPSDEVMQSLSELTIPQTGRNFKEVADELVEKVFKNAMLLQHPKFLSFVNSAVSPYSLAGAILTDIYNPHGGSWSLAPAACLIEEKLIQWMASRANYPTKNCGGLFVSGGSIANMSALIVARDNKLTEFEYPQGVAYLSDQTHSSVAKGLRMIGFRKDQIVIIPTDDDFKMRTDLLETEIERDKSAGKKPFVVIGSMGTTNTGSIDPLAEIGDICKKHDLWFHVDGAYGGSILISDIYRNLAKGIEKSDSFSWDTHKWAMQTYSCSSIIVKDKTALITSFSEHPEYLQDVINEEHTDPWNMGPEMTRPHRGLKLWLTLQVMGTDKLADIIDYSFYNTVVAEKRLKQYKNWELTSKPMCGAMTFRYVPEGYTSEQIDKLNVDITRKINSSGFAYIVTSTVKNKRVIRLSLIGGGTTTDDVTEVIDRLNEIAVELTNNN